MAKMQNNRDEKHSFEKALSTGNRTEVEQYLRDRHTLPLITWQNGLIRAMNSDDSAMIEWFSNRVDPGTLERFNYVDGVKDKRNLAAEHIAGYGDHKVSINAYEEKVLTHCATLLKRINSRNMPCFLNADALLASHTRLLKSANSYYRPLHHAALLGSETFIEHLLKLGADPNGYTTNRSAIPPIFSVLSSSFKHVFQTKPSCPPIHLVASNFTLMGLFEQFGADIHSFGSEYVHEPALLLFDRSYGFIQQNLPSTPTQKPIKNHSSALDLIEFWMDRANEKEIAPFYDVKGSHSQDGISALPFRLKAIYFKAQQLLKTAPSKPLAFLKSLDVTRPAFERLVGQECLTALMEGDLDALRSKLQYAQSKKIPYSEWQLQGTHISWFAFCITDLRDAFDVDAPDRIDKTLANHYSMRNPLFMGECLGLFEHFGGLEAIYTPLSGEPFSLAQLCCSFGSFETNRACATLLMHQTYRFSVEHPLHNALVFENQEGLKAWTQHPSLKAVYLNCFSSASPLLEHAITSNFWELAHSLAQNGICLDTKSASMSMVNRVSVTLSIREHITKRLTDKQEPPENLLALQKVLTLSEEFELKQMTQHHIPVSKTTRRL